LFNGIETFISAGPEDSDGKKSLLLEQGSKSRILWADEIESFIYGGVSSRFWVMQNFINNQPNTEDLPGNMLCWNMISLNYKSNEKLLDLII